MSSKFFKAAALSTALLLSTTSFAAYAAEVSVGGVTATANVGGGGGNIANGHVGAGGSSGDFAIGLGGGPLAKVDSNGNPISPGGNHSNAAVNLGSLLDGIDVGGVTGGGGGGGGLGGGGGGGLGGGGLGGGGAGGIGGGKTAGGLAAIAGGLSAGDQQVLKLRCRNVLASPKGFNHDVVQFCRMIAKL